jgi:uncharacterized damage-inducible protein DinB
MAVVDTLLPEFKKEMAATRKLLERVPVERGDWRPHAKSRTLLQLASHVADLPSMATRIMTSAEFDAGGPRPERPPIRTTADLVAGFDGNAEAALTALAGRPDGELTERWTFKFKGREVFTLPRTAALRATCISHLIHHRGQLTVYLRLLDVPLPSIYGPTADEDV